MPFGFCHQFASSYLQTAIDEMKHLTKIVYCIPLVLLCCGYARNKSDNERAETSVVSIVNERGTNLLKRFNAPQGYE